MKKLIYILSVFILVIAVASCSKDEERYQKWEYKTIEVWGDAYSDFYPKHFEIPQARMDTLGAQGWELVDVYTMVQTAHPNFGNAQYVTGLQPNTRTAGVFYVFKRPILEGHDKKSQKVECDTTEVIEVEEVVADTTSVG